jgi:hypothetical protein
MPSSLRLESMAGSILTSTSSAEGCLQLILCDQLHHELSINIHQGGCTALGCSSLQSGLTRAWQTARTEKTRVDRIKVVLGTTAGKHNEPVGPAQRVMWG